MNRPPRWTTALLNLCLPDGPVGRSILGDLLEEFEDRPPSSARSWWFRRVGLSLALRYGSRRLFEAASPRSIAAQFGGGSWWADTRYAARSLIQTPGFTIVAVLTLALGIGANSAIFSMIDAAILRPLPYSDPERLVQIQKTAQREGSSDRKLSPWWSYPKFEALRDESSAFEGMAAYADHYYNLTGRSEPIRLAAETISADYFSVLGVQPILGRLFETAEYDDPGAHPLVLLGHGLWQRQFGADPTVIGKTLRLGETPLTIVGVLPKGFRGLTGKAELWAPMAMVPTLSDWETALTWHGTHWHFIVAKFRNDLTMTQALDELSRVGQRTAAEYARPGMTESATAIALDSLKVDPIMRVSMLILLGAVAFVLLIGCVNVAGLLMARAVTRRRELSIRVALGASRGRLVRQLLTESVMLASIGGVAATGIAYWSLSAIAGLIPATESYFFDVHSVTLGWRVVLFTAAASIATGIAFGIVPAWRASRVDIVGTLKAGTAQVIGRPGALGRHLSGRNLMVAGQMALAIVLLIGAALLLKSFAGLRSVDAGFQPSGLLTLQVQPNLPEPRDENRIRFKQELLARFAAVPGIDGVTVSNCTPLSGHCWATNVHHVDGQNLPDDQQPLTGIQYVGTDHFKTLGIPLLRGREFSNADRKDAPLAIVINETAAEQLFPGVDPIGRRIAIGEPLFMHGETAEVVGIVGDVKYGRPEDEPGIDVYLPALRGGPSRLMVIARTSLDPTAMASTLRREVLAIDSDLPIYDVQTMNERAAEATARSRFASTLLTIFAGLALLLASLGLYSAISSQVSRRTREIGVRMALGATPGELLRQVVGSGMTVTALGIGCGTLAAFGLTRLLSRLLYGVSASDPLVFAGVSGLLASIAVLASWLPARRATRVDPVVVLRED